MAYLPAIGDDAGTRRSARSKEVDAVAEKSLAHLARDFEVGRMGECVADGVTHDALLSCSCGRSAPSGGNRADPTAARDARSCIAIPSADQKGKKL
jgi:hypothetical protein